MRVRVSSGSTPRIASPQQLLGHAVADLQRAGHAEHELDQPVVEERVDLRGRTPRRVRSSARRQHGAVSRNMSWKVRFLQVASGTDDPSPARTRSRSKKSREHRRDSAVSRAAIDRQRARTRRIGQPRNQGGLGHVRRLAVDRMVVVPRPAAISRCELDRVSPARADRRSERGSTRTRRR